jgi:hypothetical protein
MLFYTKTAGGSDRIRIHNNGKQASTCHSYSIYHMYFSRPNPGGTQLSTEPVLLNVYGAPELMPRNEFRQPM